LPSLAKVIRGVAFPHVRPAAPILFGLFGKLDATNAQDWGCHSGIHKEVAMGRGILLWLLGVPIPVILLLALIWH
jgi:hypothetical protein